MRPNWRHSAPSVYPSIHANADAIHLIHSQVNGKDVSNLTHDDAVSEFLKAAEPIVVEVRRHQKTDSIVSPTLTPSAEQQLFSLQGQHAPNASYSTIIDQLKRKPNAESSSCEVRTASVGVQTDFLFHYGNKAILADNESSIRDGHHSDGQSNPNSRENSINSINNNNINLFHHCNMLNECIAPSEIDIEVIQIKLFRSDENVLIFSFWFFELYSIMTELNSVETEARM